MDPTHDDTRTRLLNAAGEEFAERGYEAATVRGIVHRAGANIAAVHYYFASKEVLYEQALLEAHRHAMRAGQEPPLDDRPAAELLRHQVRFFLGNILDLGCDESWHSRLMLREMLDPTHASETLAREVIRPRFETMTGVIQRLRPDLEGRALQAAVFSLVGQCLFYKMARPVARHLIGAERLDLLDLDFLTDHITGFTLAALGVHPAQAPASELN